MNPAWATPEYASIRFRSVWAMASKVPIDHGERRQDGDGRRPIVDLECGKRTDQDPGQCGESGDLHPGRHQRHCTGGGTLVHVGRPLVERGRRHLEAEADDASGRYRPAGCPLLDEERGLRRTR